MTTVRIACSNLWTHAETPGERASLSALERNGELGHIHGCLTIELAGRCVPNLGYFGPDDVCLDTWVVVVNRLADPPGEYIFDEGEQGQPAFEFVRVGDELVFSVVRSVLSDGSADTAWQNVNWWFTQAIAAIESEKTNVSEGHECMVSAAVDGARAGASRHDLAVRLATEVIAGITEISPEPAP